MDSEERDCFIFYRSFYEALQDLKKEDRLQVYDAICDLALNGNETELVGLPKTIFTLIKPTILKNTKRYLNGKRGGRPKKDTIGNEEIKTTGYENKKTIGYVDKESINTNINKPYNDILNLNVNVNKKILGSGEEEKINSVINYLNTKAGTNFRRDTKSTVRSIKARLNEHYTLEDFKKVIDIKCKEWLGTDMQKYLRPETLFGSKFESYLNERPRKISTNTANTLKPDGIHQIGEVFEDSGVKYKFDEDGDMVMVD